jgi:GT2 family glycosyltransferase
MTQTTASVIVITADRPKEVKRCLTSLCGDLPENCDIIIVDASRDDQTRQIASAFSGVRYLHSPERNLSKQRNLGIESSNKEIVAFLDDDAIAHPGWLRELLAGYTSPEIASVCGAILQEDLPTVPADARPFITALGLKQPIVNWQTDKPQFVLNGQGGNMSFRRAVLDKVGYWDTTVRGGCNSGEDMDVFIKVRRAGGQIFYNPRAIVTHKPGPTSGYVRSQFNRHYMFWVGFNTAYGNTKHFLGRREFFWFFIVDAARFVLVQIGRFFRAIINNILVTLYHLAGRLYGFVAGIKYHLKADRRQQKAVDSGQTANRESKIASKT